MEVIKYSEVIPQKQKGYNILNIEVLSGQLTAKDAAIAAKIAERYGKGIIKLTQTQNFLIPWVNDNDLNSARKELENTGLSLRKSNEVPFPVACPGKLLCTKGLIETYKVAEKITGAGRKYNIPDRRTLTIGISGCFNSCSHPQIHSIGLSGSFRIPEAGGKTRIFGFELYLGGSLYPLITGDKTDVFLKENEVEGFFERIFLFSSKNLKKGETFNKMIKRVGISKFLKEISISKDYYKGEGI